MLGSEKTEVSCRVLALISWLKSRLFINRQQRGGRGNHTLILAMLCGKFIWELPVRNLSKSDLKAEGYRLRIEGPDHA